MFVGRVIGTVWSTVKWPQLAGHKLLVVQPYHLADLLQHPKTLSPSAATAIPVRAALSLSLS